ncbi:hypothetical protein AOLI_G00323610, partial [Acnodon oligacanthus]
SVTAALIHSCIFHRAERSVRSLNFGLTAAAHDGLQSSLLNMSECWSSRTAVNSETCR